MSIATILQRLDALQARIAKETMETPQSPDLFDYGKAVGTYAGVNLARTEILALFSEKDRDLDL